MIDEISYDKIDQTSKINDDSSKMIDEISYDKIDQTSKINDDSSKMIDENIDDKNKINQNEMIDIEKD